MEINQKIRVQPEKLIKTIRELDKLLEHCRKDFDKIKPELIIKSKDEIFDIIKSVVQKQFIRIAKKTSELSQDFIIPSRFVDLREGSYSEFLYFWPGYSSIYRDNQGERILSYGRANEGVRCEIKKEQKK